MQALTETDAAANSTSRHSTTTSSICRTFTTANNGPGQNEVFIAGLERRLAGQPGERLDGVWPNVAIYLDNQSGQLPNRNLDIYAADLKRIEVLEGPQGTLFGAAAEAGVIRYITNEPKLDVTEANLKAGYGVTAHGDPNTDLTAVLNLPLIANTMAVRAVIYNDKRGGYIDNVPATFTRKNTDVGIHYAAYQAVGGVCPDGQPNSGSCVPPGSPVINNGSVVGRAINPVTYQGIRAEVLYKFNEDWNALITQSYQNMDSRGVFLPAAQCLGWRGSVATRSHPVQRRLRQGQVRKHRLDGEWQVRRSESRVYRRLPGAQPSIRLATTRITRAAYSPITTSASVRHRPQIHSAQPASRRAPPGTRPSATRTSSTNSA